MEFAVVLPTLMAVNEGILPEPLLPNPMAELLLVQLKTAPEGTLDKVVKGTTSSVQKSLLEGLTILGLGLTLMVKFCAFPTQLLISGTTVIAPLIVLFVTLLATKDGIFPLPAESNPMAVLLLLHV
jgi:hypothetical protein